jgi:hypothetical protein
MTEANLGWRTKDFQDSNAHPWVHHAPQTRAGGDIRVSAPDTTERRETMDRNLGVWTYEDCALVLLDYQPEMLEVIRSETEICLTSARQGAG